MSLDQCLVRLQADGTIDAERANRFRAEYTRLRGNYAKKMSEAAAADLAGRDTLDALDWQAFHARRQAMLQIDTQSRLLKALTQYMENGGRGGKPGQAKHFLAAVMEHHEAVGRGQGLAVDNVRGGYHMLAYERMSDFLLRYRRDILGRVRKGGEAEAVARVLRGEKSDDPNVNEMAAAIKDTLEWLRQEFNKQGGNIGKLPDYLPQSHDAMRVGKDYQTWRDFIKARLAPDKMIDNQTGAAFASDAALEEALKAAWRNISSEGMDGQVPGQFRGDGKLANRHSDHRFFVFKDADAWLEYNKAYGTGDVFDAINGHIDSMTRDIAAMKQLGPNPALTVQWLSDLARQQTLPTIEGGKDIKLQRGSKRAADKMQDMWGVYSGQLTGVAPENRTMARTFSGIRNWNVIEKLGGSFLSAISTDPIFMGMTARFNGLAVSHTLFDWAKLFNPLDATHREVAAHGGLVTREWTQRAEDMWREGQGFNVHELTRRGADALLRVTLVTPHTVAGKQAMGLGFMKDWADNAHLRFDQFARANRLALQRYGITPADWDALRQVGVYTDRGVKLLRPGDLARSGGADAIAQALKFATLIDSETRFGLPSESLRAQTAVETLGSAISLRHGTLGAEVLKSMGQFKTFSIMTAMMHLQRAVYGEGGMSRIAYTMAMPTLLTLGGLVGNWMIDIANGKDPEPIDKPLTWIRAWFRGGVMGNLGDIASQAMSGQPGSYGAVAGYVAGPTIGSIVDPAINLSLGNIGRYENGQDIKFSSELARQARNHIPGGTIWYARAAVNRMWADQLQQMADPNYLASYKRLEDKARTEGTQYYWRPGEMTPGRAPNFANALGQQQPQLEEAP